MRVLFLLEFKNQMLKNGVPPIMSCFDSNKTTAVGENFIEKQRLRLKTLIESTELITIIGISLREHDVHLWNSLRNTNAKLMYCGRNGSVRFIEWHDKYRKNKPYLIFGGYFSDHFSDICDTTHRFINRKLLVMR